MLKGAFITLRVLTGIASLATFAGTMVLISHRSLPPPQRWRTRRNLGHKTLRLGFSKIRPAQPVPHLLSLPLIGFATIFLSMFASVFTPGRKIFLHIVAALALAAAAWRIWIMVHKSDNQLYYLPVIALWFIYHGVCLRHR